MSPKRLDTTDKAASQGRPYHTSTKRAITFTAGMMANTHFLDRIRNERTSYLEQIKNTANSLADGTKRRAWKRSSAS